MIIQQDWQRCSPLISVVREKTNPSVLRNVRCLPLIIHLPGKDPRTFPTILSPKAFFFSNRDVLVNECFSRAYTRHRDGYR